MDLYMEEEQGRGLQPEKLKECLKKSLEGKKLKKVLLIPPDFSRYHSNAGMITSFYYHMLTEQGIETDVMPALGTHEPVSEKQFRKMFEGIPYEKKLVHNWKKDVVKIGEIPKEYMSSITEGIWNEPLSVEVNYRLLDPSYDLIISVGQVVPHEVIGMANHSKNIFVGVGGRDMINKSHMVGAFYGMERIMGKDHTPVRKAFDYALEHFLSDLPLLFVLTVTTAKGDHITTHGLYIGETRKTLERAIEMAQKRNIDFLDRGIKKCVVYLDPSEFHSTWIGNKSIYRTRMAISDGGELLVLAPGVSKFGEDAHMDALIRKYGYCGRKKILELFQKNQDLKDNMGCAAHLIHGSGDGRFQVTYAVKEISKQEIENVYFQAADYEEMIKKYDPKVLKYGWNKMQDGEEIFFIPNPALGLWIDSSRF